MGYVTFFIDKLYHTKLVKFSVILHKVILYNLTYFSPFLFFPFRECSASGCGGQWQGKPYTVGCILRRVQVLPNHTK